MKLLMRDEAKGREHTIFVTIFSALMVMLAIVVMLMASATAISGVTLQLDENAVDILDKQVENRAGYIQDQLQQAQELTDLSTYINETTQQMLDDFGRRMQSQGLSLEQYFQFTGLTYEHMMEQVKPQAERRIKSRLVLEAVAAAENIEATEEDFDAEVKRMAEGYKMEADKIKELMGEQGKKQIMEDLAVRKAVDFVVSEAVEK